MFEFIAFSIVFLLTTGFGFFLLTEKFDSSVCVTMCMVCGILSSVLSAHTLSDSASQNETVIFMVMIYLMFLIGLVLGQAKERRRDWWPKMALFLVLAVGVMGMSFQLMY